MATNAEHPIFHKPRDSGRTISQSAEVAGALAAEKRAAGYTVTVTSHGSDDKRGMRPYIVVEWKR